MNISWKIDHRRVSEKLTGLDRTVRFKESNPCCNCKDTLLLVLPRRGACTRHNPGSSLSLLYHSQSKALSSFVKQSLLECKWEEIWTGQTIFIWTFYFDFFFLFCMFLGMQILLAIDSPSYGFRTSQSDVSETSFRGRTSSLWRVHERPIKAYCKFFFTRRILWARVKEGYFCLFSFIYQQSILTLWGIMLDDFNGVCIFLMKKENLR